MQVNGDELSAQPGALIPEGDDLMGVFTDGLLQIETMFHLCRIQNVHVMLAHNTENQCCG